MKRYTLFLMSVFLIAGMVHSIAPSTEHGELARIFGKAPAVSDAQRKDAEDFAHALLQGNGEMLSKVNDAIARKSWKQWRFGDPQVGAEYIKTDIVHGVVKALAHRDKKPMLLLIMPGVFERVFPVEYQLAYQLLRACYEFEKNEQAKHLTQQFMALFSPRALMGLLLSNDREPKEIRHGLFKMAVNTLPIEAFDRASVIRHALVEGWADMLLEDTQFFNKEVALTEMAKHVFLMALEKDNDAVVEKLKMLNENIVSAVHLTERRTGDTPLHRAVREGNVEFAARLRTLCGERCLNKQNKEGKSPRDLVDQKNEAMMKALNE